MYKRKGNGRIRMALVVLALLASTYTGYSWKEYNNCEPDSYFYLTGNQTDKELEQ